MKIAEKKLFLTVNFLQSIIGSEKERGQFGKDEGKRSYPDCLDKPTSCAGGSQLEGGSLENF